MAWRQARIDAMIKVFEGAGVAVTESPLGGTMGKDGDCLLIVGMQQDNAPGGARPVDGAEECAGVIAKLASCLECRGDGKWAVGVAKDLMPSDHCLFAHKAGQGARAPHCVANTQGSELHWQVHDSLAHLHTVYPRRVIVGFKSYHEQIHSPSAFQYSVPTFEELQQSGFDRERNMNRVLSKLLAYTGCVAAPCAAADSGAGLRNSHLDAPPDIMSLHPYTSLLGAQVSSPPLHEALAAAVSGKKAQGSGGPLRRLFVVGLPLEEDVLDTALAAKLRGLATDVFIVVDACAFGRGSANSPSAHKDAAALLAKHNIRLTVSTSVVFPRPRYDPFCLPASGDGAAAAATAAEKNAEAAAAAVVPAAGDHAVVLMPRQRVTYNSAGGATADAAPMQPSQPSPAEEGAAVGGGGGEAPTRFAMKHDAKTRDRWLTTFALEYFMVGFSAEKIAEVLQGIDDGGGQQRHRVPKDPHLGLGRCVMKWLNRDVTRSAEWRWGVPAVVLKSAFPTGVASLAFTVSAKTSPVLENAYGGGSFHVPVEEVMRLIGTRTFVTQHGCLASLRRVIQRVLSSPFMSYFSMLTRFPLHDCLNGDGDLTTALVRDAERRAAEEGAATPEGKPTDEVVWVAERAAEITADWKRVLLCAQKMQAGVDEMRGSLADHRHRAALDEALKYSLQELASLGCVRCEGYFLVDTAQQLQTCRGKPCVFVTACPPDFSSVVGRDPDFVRYFEDLTHGGVAWRLTGRQQLLARLKQTFRCVFAAFQQAGTTSLSLAPLCMRAMDLAPLPPPLRRDVVGLACRALFTVLEDVWGFGQVFAQVPEEYLGLASEELQAGYTLCTTVALHTRHAADVAQQLGTLSGRTGTDAGYMVCGDVYSVMLGQVGGAWEGHGGEAALPYSHQEDLANTSTYLFTHFGVSPDGLLSEEVKGHTAVESLQAVVGPPLKNALRKQQPKRAG